MTAIYNSQRGYQVMFCIIPVPSHNVDRIVSEIVAYDNTDEAENAIKRFSENRDPFITFKAVKLF